MRTASGAARPAWVRWAALAGLALVALLLLAPLSRFITASSSWLDYPYPRPGSEGLILYESLLLKRGGDIYAPITPERFVSGPYPPIYYGLAAALLPDRLPDFAAPPVASIFRDGRAASLIAALCAAALLVLLVLFDGGYHLRDRPTLALGAAGGLVGAMAFLTLPQVEVWATRFRGDMLMIALTAAGLAAVSTGAPAGRVVADRLTPWPVMAAAFFSLAFFTKQTAIAGPVATAAYLLLVNWRLGLKWCAVMFLAVALPFTALELATGNWFYLKMVVYHSLPLSRLTLERLLRIAFLESQWPLILACAGYALYRIAGLLTGMRAWGSKTDGPLLVPLFAAAAMLTLPTGAVVGADHNHLLMPGLAVCAGVGALLASGLTLVDSSRPLLRAAPLLAGLLLVAVYSLFTSGLRDWYVPDLSMPGSDVREQLRKITLYVRDTTGALFFSDDPGVLSLAGKRTPYDDPFTMTALAPQGRWDESAYRDMLRSGKFALLVLDCDVPATLAGEAAAATGQHIDVGRPCRADTFSPGVLDAIRDGYKILFRDVRFTYVPR